MNDSDYTSEVRQSFTITFEDRVSATVHTEDIARNIVTGNYDPRSFAPGTVATVTRHVTEWSGDHDDRNNPRTFTELLSVEMPLDALTTPHVEYPHLSGRLLDCYACEAACWCGDLRSTTPCVHCGDDGEE